MMKRNNQFINLATLPMMFICISLMPEQGLAFGIGDIDMHSGFHEPVHAEVPLYNVNADDIQALDAGLAPPSTFRRVGLRRHPILDRLEFSVVERGEGIYVHIASDEAITEPFLSLILEVTSPRTRLLREYTVLLDPPTDASEPQTTGSKQTDSDAPASDSADIERSPLQDPPTERDGPSKNFHWIESGETTLELAGRFAPDGVTAYQMAVALLRDNPDAFIEDNVHRLRSGRVLDIPSVDRVEGIDVAGAVETVNRHATQMQNSPKETNDTATGELEIVAADTNTDENWPITGTFDEVTPLSDIANSTTPKIATNATLTGNRNSNASAAEPTSYADAPNTVSTASVHTTSANPQLGEPVAATNSGLAISAGDVEALREELKRTRETLAIVVQQNKVMTERLEAIELAVAQMKTRSSSQVILPAQKTSRRESRAEYGTSPPLPDAVADNPVHVE